MTTEAATADAPERRTTWTFAWPDVATDGCGVPPWVAYAGDGFLTRALHDMRTTSYVGGPSSEAESQELSIPLALPFVPPGWAISRFRAVAFVRGSSQSRMSFGVWAGLGAEAKLGRGEKRGRFHGNDFALTGKYRLLRTKWAPAPPIIEQLVWRGWSTQASGYLRVACVWAKFELTELGPGEEPATIVRKPSTARADRKREVEAGVDAMLLDRGLR